jgi:beta-galactosidase
MVKIERDAAGKLVCYTNLKSVEFSQKGIMAGTIRPLPSATHVIDVPGDPKKGPITVVGYQNGNPVAQDIYTLPGAAAAVKMRQYKTLLGPGDGPNVAQIELGIVDAKGNRVVSAQQDVAITLNGSGRLLGIESGDNDSLENYQTPHHKVFHGRRIVYVQTQGRVEVEATAAGLSSAKILVGN